MVYIKIKLPNFIFSSDNVDFFSVSYGKPNFITNKVITSEVINLTSQYKKNDLDNRIVLIENADPGYDWIFTHHISGLITKYGGIASHMAIRCQEFNLPAAIGCGELLFNDIISKKNVTLDCEKEIINGHQW